MKKIGLVCAVEINAIFKKFGAPVIKEFSNGYEIMIYNFEKYSLFVVKSMMGEIYASATTQFLITKYNVDMIVNFGVVGGLTMDMSSTKLCIVRNAIHYDMDTSAIDNIEVGRYYNYESVYLPSSPELIDVAIRLYPELKVVNCASADKFVADADAKHNLAKQFNAEICDMESAAIILIANRNEKPVMLIKCVADGLTGGGEEYTQAFDNTSSLALDMLDGIIKCIVNE